MSEEGKTKDIFSKPPWVKWFILGVMGIILLFSSISIRFPQKTVTIFSSWRKRFKELVVEKKSPKGYDVITSATIMVKSEKEDNLK